MVGGWFEDSFHGDNFALQRRRFGGRFLQRGDWINPGPTESAQDVNRGGDPESEWPISVRIVEDVTDGDRRDATGEVARHVHAAGEGAGKSTAHIHATVPTPRQGKVER